MQKNHIWISIAMAAIVLIPGCATGSSYVGTWETSGKQDQIATESVLHIATDGSFEMSLSIGRVGAEMIREEFEGEWTLEGKRIILTANDHTGGKIRPLVLDGQLNKGLLHIKMPGANSEMIYEHSK